MRSKCTLKSKRQKVSIYDENMNNAMCQYGSIKVEK